MLANRLMAVAKNRSIFLASGTFTVPAGVTTIYATLVGRGGAGASGSPGGGGGAGGAVYGYVFVGAGDIITVTIDATGSSAIKGSGPVITAYNGADGSGSFRGVGGGAFVGGWISLSTRGGANGVNAAAPFGGDGGTFDPFRNISGLGGAGAEAPANGGNATGYGSGGGGSGIGTTGGAGSAGIVILEW
jgi:hypothetical protein